MSRRYDIDEDPLRSMSTENFTTNDMAKSWQKKKQYTYSLVQRYKIPCKQF